MKCSSPQFGRLFQLSSAVVEKANRQFENRGEPAYRDFLHQKTGDKAVSKGEYVQFDMPGGGSLLATNTRKPNMTLIKAAHQTYNRLDPKPNDPFTTWYLQQPGSTRQKIDTIG